MSFENKSETAATAKSEAVTLSPEPRPRPWTVMIFLAGDNNLSEDMITALRCIKTVGDTNDQINLLVRYDSVYPPVPTGYYDFSSDKKANSLAKPIKEEPTKSGRESLLAAGSGSSVADFVKWAKDFYPATENYVLILSGHGDAFRGKTFLLDEDPAGSMSIKELKSTLAEVNKILGKKLAILGFDSCAMNLLEIGYELRGTAEFLVSSEGFIPKCGWAYAGVLARLAKSPKGVKPESLATDFVNEFVNENKDYVIAGRSVEMSATRLDALDGVFEAFNLLVDELLDVFPASLDNQTETAGFVQNHLVKLIMYSHWRAQTFFYEQTVDLLDFCSVLRDQCIELRATAAILGVGSNENEVAKALLKKLGGVEKCCTTVIKTAGDTKYVVHKSFCGPEFQFARGVSIYFPWSFISYLVSSGVYKTLLLQDGETQSKWMTFLERFTLFTAREHEKTEIKWPTEKFFTNFIENNKKTSPSWKTGTPFKDDMDTMKRYFSSFKNNWIDSNEAKPDAGS